MKGIHDFWLYRCGNYWIYFLFFYLLEYIFFVWFWLNQNRWLLWCCQSFWWYWNTSVNDSAWILECLVCRQILIAISYNNSSGRIDHPVITNRSSSIAVFAVIEVARGSDELFIYTSAITVGSSYVTISFECF